MFHNCWEQKRINLRYGNTRESKMKAERKGNTKKQQLFLTTSSLVLSLEVFYGHLTIYTTIVPMPETLGLFVSFLPQSTFKVYSSYFFSLFLPFIWFFFRQKKTPHELTSFHPRLLRAHVRLNVPFVFRRFTSWTDAGCWSRKFFSTFFPRREREKRKISRENFHDNGRPWNSTSFSRWREGKRDSSREKWEEKQHRKDHFAQEHQIFHFTFAHKSPIFWRGNLNNFQLFSQSLQAMQKLTNIPSQQTNKLWWNSRVFHSGEKRERKVKFHHIDEALNDAWFRIIEIDFLTPTRVKTVEWFWWKKRGWKWAQISTIFN